MLDNLFLDKLSKEFNSGGDSHVFSGKNYDYFLERVSSAYARIKNFIPNKVLKGRSLDVGCGAGTGVAASLALGASFSVGIDIDINSHSSKLDINEYEDQLSTLGVDPDKFLLINLNVFEAFFKKNSFDYITFIDVAEHIPDIPFFLKWSYEALKPGGYILIDTLPLYYSPVGHHLWPVFTEEECPWAHLRKDFKEKFIAACPDASFDDWSKDLNKATWQEIYDAACGAGFDIIFKHRDHPHIHPGRYEKFCQIKDCLDLTGIEESWLFEARIILTGRK